MVKFLLKCTVLIGILFFGVLLGMQEANNGLLKMKGYDASSFSGAFDINQNKQGDVEASVLGQKVTSLTLQEKKKKLEQFKAFNFFSSMGAKVASFMTYTFQALIQFIVTTIDQLLSMMGT